MSGLTSILSQFRPHFQAWRDRCRNDKWLDLWGINHIFFYFGNALACLSNPVPQHTLEKKKTSSSDYNRTPPASRNLFHGFTESYNSGLLAQPGPQAVWVNTTCITHFVWHSPLRICWLISHFQWITASFPFVKHYILWNTNLGRRSSRMCALWVL